MSSILLLQFLILALLLLGSGFFSSAEVALFSLDPLDIREMDSSQPESAKKVRQIMISPTGFLSTILIGNTLINVGVSSVSYTIAERLIPTHAELTAVIGAVFLLLIFGEIGPKRIAMTHPQRLAHLYAPALLFFIRASRPIRGVLDRITVAFSHLFTPQGRVLSEDEYETVIELSREEGVLDEEESSMVKGIMKLEELRASDVMTPRVDIIGIDIGDDSEDPMTTVKKARVRQILVYRNQMDAVEGLLDCRKYLLDPEHDMWRAMVPPSFIPEACPLDKLLSQFLKENRRTAIVVGEYGGTAGLIARGDILEEITGDIDDEKGGHELLLRELGTGRWMLDGRVSLEKLQDEFNLEFEEEGVDRIAGWIAAQLERIPKPGDTVNAGLARFRVQHMRRNRVTLVEMVLNQKGSG